MNDPAMRVDFRRKRIKHGFRLIGSGTTPSSSTHDCYTGEIPWVTSSELRETIISETAQRITKEAFGSHSDVETLSVRHPPLFAMYPVQQLGG